MKVYTIVGGPHGCGKSSLLGILCSEVNNIGRVINEYDNIDSSNDNINTNEYLYQSAKECIESGICFTQEITLLNSQILATVKKALEYGYCIRLYYVGLNTVEESLLRIQNRKLIGGCDISRRNIENSFTRRYDDLVAILPYCNEAIFFDNENGFVGVAEYKNKEWNQLTEALPEWMIPFFKYIKEE